MLTTLLFRWKSQDLPVDGIETSVAFTSRGLKQKTQNLSFGHTKGPISIGSETVEQVDLFC